MMDNFSHEMGMLAISFSRVEEVVPFIIKEANALNICVADGQSEEIFRPNRATGQKSVNQCWWKFWQ
jgi:hypothetical protein